MKDVWTHHLKYYDLFQNNIDAYRKTIQVIVETVKGFNHIIDLGCGSGNVTLELLRARHSVEAVDSDAASIQVLEQKCAQFAIRTYCQSADEFQGQADAITSMFLLPFIDAQSLFENVLRCLHQEGLFVFAAWLPQSGKELTALVKEELTRKKILPKYDAEWNHIQLSTKETTPIVEHAPSQEELIALLQKVGFVDVEVLESPYGKFATIISCKAT